MNARWHQQHPMPKNASLAARIAWHVAHRKACACRPVPASVLAALGEGGGEAPAAASSKAERPPRPPATARRARTARSAGDAAVKANARPARKGR